MPCDALVRMSAVEMSQAVRERKVSPVELVEAHLQQINALNPKLNAIVSVRHEEALAEARAAEAAVMRGDDLGLLGGVPITIKSCLNVSGMKCETGSLLRKGMVASEDAALVSRLRQAGAIILGTTNVPEMLMAYETGNLLYGNTRSPWDLERTPGGSSGGEAAAIAACMSAGGVGSDGGGSIRVPAHYTGICGLKPTPGRIPATGHYPEGLGPFAMLGVVGPMARTVDDLRAMFSVMAGPDDGDTSSAPVPLRIPDASELKGIKIGYLEEDEICPVTPETRKAVLAAVDALKREGFDVVQVRPSYLRQAREYWWTLFVRLGAEVIRPMFAGREQDVSPILQDFLDIAAGDTPLNKQMLLDAWFGRDQLRLQMMQEMKEVPILLSPVCAIPAFRHGEREWTVEGKRVDYLQAMSYTQFWNLLGNPGAVVPVAQSLDQLPIGVQVIGKPYEEEVVLEIAAILDRSFGYREPPILNESASLAHTVS